MAALLLARRLRIAGACFRRAAFFVCDGAGVDAILFFHGVAMRHSRSVFDRSALLLRLRRGDRGRRNDGREHRHVTHLVTSRLARRSVVLLILLKTNQRETI